MKTTKSVIALLLVMLISVGCTISVFGAYADENNTSDYYFAVGDVNMDYILNAADARRIIRVAAKMDKFYPQGEWVGSNRMLGDADFDGKITANDARLVLRIAAGVMTVTQLYEMVNAKQAKYAASLAAQTTTQTKAAETTTASETTTAASGSLGGFSLSDLGNIDLSSFDLSSFGLGGFDLSSFDLSSFDLSSLLSLVS